jgi:hypothetical protein
MLSVSPDHHPNLAPIHNGSNPTLCFSSTPDNKNFSIRRITSVITKVGKVAGKVADVAGKVAMVAALI